MNDFNIENVNEFKYLKAMLTGDKNNSAEIKQRISQGNKSFTVRKP